MFLQILLDIRCWTTLTIMVGAYLLRPRKPPFPVVNAFANDFFGRKAYKEQQANAQGLIARGLADHKGTPFSIAIPHKHKIVLPASLAGWVKSNKNLDHKALVAEDFLAGIPGFEGQTVLQAHDEVVFNVIKTKLGQNDSTVAVMNGALDRAFRATWTNSTDWHTLDWQNDTTGIIARAASSIFVGPEKAEDPEWLELVQGYTLAYFSGVGELNSYPPWSRSLVHWFLPNLRICRKYVARATELMKDVQRQRQEAITEADRLGVERPVYNDALAWTDTASRGEAEPGHVQLTLAMAALFTTSELFRQVLADVASHPELIEPLRKEITKQLSASGLTVAATSNMVLLDSVMKESQRLSSAVVGLERKVTAETALPDGTIIPRGAHIMVETTDLWNPDLYPSPEAFDGYRFLRMREAGDKSNQFVQSSPNFNVFGGGRHICPGRFFAANEIKLAMAHILLKYDVRVAEGYQSNPMRIGFYAIVDPMVQMQVRRRLPDDANLSLLGS